MVGFLNNVVNFKIILKKVNIKIGIIIVLLNCLIVFIFEYFLFFLIMIINICLFLLFFI